MLRDEVYQLRDHYDFRGMNILQFTFDPKKAIAPDAGKAHMVVYTGTHDNETVQGWYARQPLTWRLKAWWQLRRAGCGGGSAARRFVRLALMDAADIAVIPVQDVLGLGDSARMNTPGTVGSPNWEWKLVDFGGLEQEMGHLAQMVKDSGRG